MENSYAIARKIKYSGISFKHHTIEKEGEPLGE